MMVLPVPESVPTVALPLAMPSTLQVTAVLVEPVTAAVKAWVPLAARLAELGVRLTATTGTGAATVMEAEALLEASALLVALRVWLPAAAGAV